MAVRVDFTGVVASEIERIAAELMAQLLSGLEQCRKDTPPEFIHHLRKTTKRLRALLSLVSKQLPRDDQRRWRAVLRAAANELAGQRETAVLEQTLTEAYRALVPEVDPATRPWLNLTVCQQVGERDTRRADRSSIQTTIDLLRKQEATIAGSLDPTLEGLALIKAVARSYRQARRKFAELREAPTNERFHEWRKSVKTQLYQLRMIVHLAPKILRAEAVEFDQLAELLGEHHDLCDLRHAVEASRATYLPIVELRGLDDWVTRRMADLEREALRLARRLLAESPKARRHRFEQYYVSMRERVSTIKSKDDPNADSNGDASPDSSAQVDSLLPPSLLVPRDIET